MKYNPHDLPDLMEMTADQRAARGMSITQEEAAELWGRYFGEDMGKEAEEFITKVQLTFNDMQDCLKMFEKLMNVWASEKSNMIRTDANNPKNHDKTYNQLGFILYNYMALFDHELDQSLDCPHFKMLIDKYRNTLENTIEHAANEVAN